MVHFPPLPSPAYVFSGRYSGMSQSGFPHSEIPGSKPACGSPRLIAACHVLHRLLAPRHSPYALSSLTKCSLHLTANMWSKKLPIAEYSVVKKLRLRRIATSARQALSDSPHFNRNSVRLRCFAASARQPPLFRGLPSRSPEGAEAGGEYRDRTGDLLVANQALSQLS